MRARTFGFLVNCVAGFILLLIAALVLGAAEDWFLSADAKNDYEHSKACVERGGQVIDGPGLAEKSCIMPKAGRRTSVRISTGGGTEHV